MKTILMFQAIVAAVVAAVAAEADPAYLAAGYGYGLGLGYAGLGYAGLGYSAPLAYSGYAAPLANRYLW